MKIAMAQYPISQHSSLEGWKKHIRQWVSEAAGESAEVLVFPEYGSMELVSCLPPSTQQSLSMQITDLQKLLPEFMAAYSALAKEFQVSILAPSFPVNDPKYPRPVNRAYFFSPNGQSKFQDKVHMTRFEDEIWGIGPGNPTLEIFDVNGIRLGASICFDVEFPFAAVELASKGVQVLLAPSCTETLKGLNRVHIGARARALENQFYVAVSQTVGDAPWSEAVDLNTGIAAAYSTCDLGFPDDGILSMGTLNREGWVYANLNTELIQKVRTEGQVLNFKKMKSYVKNVI